MTHAATPPAGASPSTAHQVTWLGLLGLASAMGIGRFAFTPMLPLMQQAHGHGGLALSQGAQLASANYLGYLLGAWACTVAPPSPPRAARWGLVAVALLTLGMGLTHSVALWLLLRCAAGAASACVLVGVSGWALPLLAQAGRVAWAGRLYAGVGLGITLAGLICLHAGQQQWAPAHAWWVLGALSSAVALCAWSPLRAADGRAGPAATAAGKARKAPLGAEGWRLVGCYGSFGIGYIIPATFLPTMARAWAADPAVFGWIWPVFGVTGAASTLLAPPALRRFGPRRVWAVSQGVMAVGVLAPLCWPGLAGLLVAALCVGGTFMLMTLAGFNEARRMAGEQAPRWMAAMTTAFALGQCIGPLVVAAEAARPAWPAWLPSALAAAVLLAGGWALRRPAAAGDLPTCRTPPSPPS